MPAFAVRCLFISVLVILAGCTDAGRRLDGSLGVVEVIETPPPIPVASHPPQLTPLLATPPPQLFFAEPLPSPVRHVVQARLVPAGARALNEVQSIEVEVEVEGGRRGEREIALVFVSPQGLVWERQQALIETTAGGRTTATFSLPVAATFVEEQKLSGDWQVRSIDEGVEQATSSVTLEAVRP